jgi:hypothetical protein
MKAVRIGIKASRRWMIARGVRAYNEFSSAACRRFGNPCEAKTFAIHHLKPPKDRNCESTARGFFEKK